MIKIPEAEIRKRLRKLSNYENIRMPQLKERNERLKVENKELKQELARREEAKKIIEKLELELEELRALKFGKKRGHRKSVGSVVKTPFEVEESLEAKTEAENGEKNGGKNGENENEKEEKEAKTKKERSPESYRRSEPDPEKITDHLHLGIDKCSECQTELEDKRAYTHYREDIKKVEELLKAAQQIVKTTIESGKCPNCKTRKFAMEVPKQKVIFGENLRRMVVHLVVMQGQSYSETARSLRHQYGYTISQGEIAKILEGESRLLTPYYNHLLETLDSEKMAHYDETTWKTHHRGQEISEGNYAWTKVGVKSENQIIWFGRSRGKGVAEELRGPKEGSIGISDNYGSYHNLFDHHQLCWAHPHRKFRDLAQSGTLKGKTKKACEKAFKDFANVYKKSQKAHKKLKSGVWNESQKLKEKQKLEASFAKLFQPTDHDPEKLTAIRKSLKEKKSRYFTFFDFPDIPLDNNKAERSLRKVVLKRKKSFGCQSQKGANVLSILYSVVFSMMANNPNENFFILYEKMADFEGQ